MEVTRKSRADLAREWWEDLQANPGARSVLRRAQTPLDALMEPATLRLMLMLGWKRPEYDEGRDFLAERITTLAILLAHVREDDSAPVGRRVGLDQDGRALMSRARWSRLIAAEAPEELLDGMLALISLAGGKINVTDLSSAVLNWTHPSSSVRTRWQYEYLGIPRGGDATPVHTEQ